MSQLQADYIAISQEALQMLGTGYTTPIPCRKKHTNGLITSKTLRGRYAQELWQARKLRCLGAEYWSGLRFGLETGFWALEKMLRQDVLR